MKNAIALMTLILAAGSVQAKTICGIATSKEGSPGMTYDVPVYHAEVQEQKSVLIAKDGRSAEEIRLEDLKTVEQWKAVDGRMLAVFHRQANGQYTISLGMFDLSNTANTLPIHALSVGRIAKDSYLILMVPSKNLSLSCFEL